MDTKERAWGIFSYIRTSKRNILSASLIFAAASVFLIIFGAYALVFHYYGNRVISHYSSLLREKAEIFISFNNRAAYRQELMILADSLKGHRGIVHAWCTDNVGRLIYHTDETLQSEYRSSRLPADYFANIQHAWAFREGYPVEKVVPLSLLSLRISIPLYASSRAESAFILGIDAKRFLFLPKKIMLFTPMLFGYITFTVLLFFLLLYFRTKHRFVEIASQAHLLEDMVQGKEAVGDSESSEEKSAVLLEEVYKELEEEEIQRGELEGAEEAPDRETEKERVKTEEETQEKEKETRESEEVEEAEGETEEEQPVQEEAAGGETEEEKPLDQAIVEKTLVLPFVETSSFSFSSPLAEGSYLFYHHKRPLHFYALFSCSSLEKGREDEQSAQIGESIKREIEQDETLKEVIAGCNDSFYRNHLSIDLSLLSIDETKKTLEYSSCGRGTALYLKQGEEEVKSLFLDVPGLGTLPKEEFMERFYSARIVFVKDDILALLPPNSSRIIIDGKNLGEQVTASMLSGRQKSVYEIGMEVSSSIRQQMSETKEMHETGYVVLKLV